MGGQLATGSSIYMASAGVPAADGAGLSSIKSFSQLLTSIAAMPLAGGTFIGHVLFTDNTYDIGASGATRPRTVYAGTSVITPLLNNSNAAALTLGNSTYGVTVPGKLSIGRSPSGATTALDVYNASASVQATIQSGNNFCELLLTSGSTAIPNYITSNGNLSFIVGGSERAVINQSTGTATFSGDVSMSKTSAQGYIYAYDTAATAYIRMYAQNTNTYLNSSQRMWLTSATDIFVSPTNGNTLFFKSGTNSVVDVFAGNGSTKTTITHDGTNGILSTSSGNLNLAPTGGTVAVTGGITASGVVSHGAYTVATLPAAGSNAGKMAQVTDSNVAASGNYGATVAAGGANRVKVFSDGTNWVIA